MRCRFFKEDKTGLLSLLVTGYSEGVGNVDGEFWLGKV